MKEELFLGEVLGLIGEAEEYERKEYEENDKSFHDSLPLVLKSIKDDIIIFIYLLYAILC